MLPQYTMMNKVGLVDTHAVLILLHSFDAFGVFLLRQFCMGNSTYHTYFMDVETGAPRFGSTAQGYSDTSCWARGQAWAVYGFTLSERRPGSLQLPR